MPGKDLVQRLPSPNLHIEGLNVAISTHLLIAGSIWVKFVSNGSKGVKIKDFTKQKQAKQVEWPK